MNKVRNSIAVLLKTHKAKLLMLLILVALTSRSSNDPILLTKSYIHWYAEEAVNQMVEHRIPASVILAQAIFESRCGSSDLARKSNNHFGIKCHLEWGGDTVVKTDDTLNECFRKYRSVEDSYTDHSLFLKSRSRYAHLFELDVTDYKGWCKGLKAAGYATFPAYADELIKIIEEYKLYLLDAFETIEKRSIDPQKEVLSSRLSPQFATIKDLMKSGSLFADEQNMLIQSLELVTEESETFENLLAEGKN